MKKINQGLMLSQGIELDDIHFIFITHVHSDHILSVSAIYNKYEHIRFCVNQELKKEVELKLEKEFDDSRFIFIDDYSDGNNIKIGNFELKHDEYCLGWYIIEKSSGESLCFISDNGGWLTWKNNDFFADYNDFTYYLIESNYDRNEQLATTKRDSILKRRVLSNKGHTDNYDAIANMVRLVGDNTKGVMFTHLSEDTNSYELAMTTHMNYLEVWGKLNETKHIKFSYAQQHKITDINSGLTHKELRGVR